MRQASQAEVEVPDDVPVLRRAAASAARRERHVLHQHRLPGRSACSASRTTPRVGAWTSRGWARSGWSQLVAAGLVNDPADLYRPHRRAAGGAGAVRATSRPTTWSPRSRPRRASRSAGCWWLWGSATWGRRGPGRWPAPSARSTPSSPPSTEELAAVDGVGGVIAASVAEFLGQPSQRGGRRRGCGPQGSIWRSRGPPGRRAAGEGRRPRPNRRWPARPWWSPGRCRATRGRGPRRRSWRGAGSRRGACRRRPSCWSWGRRPGASKLKKAEELGHPHPATRRPSSRCSRRASSGVR